MAPSEHRTRRNKVFTHSMSTRMQRPHPPLPPGLGSSLCLFSSSPGLGLLGTPLALQPPDTHLPLTYHPCPPQGYSFVAPSILFDHNNAVMTDVLEVPGAEDRPGRAAVARSAMMQVGWARVGRSWLGGSGPGPASTRRPQCDLGEVWSLSEVGHSMATWPQGSQVGPLMHSLCPQDSPFFQQYELDLREPALGQGSFSVCRRCRQRQGGLEFAVKILSRRWVVPGWAGPGRGFGRAVPEVGHPDPRLPGPQAGGEYAARSGCPASVPVAPQRGETARGAS